MNRDRDDMVIRLDLPAGAGAGSTVADEQEELEQRIAERRKASRLRLIKKAARLRAAKKLASRLASRGGIKAPGGWGIGRVLANPVGAIAAAAAIAAAVVARVKTGRTFANMGANLEHELIGDMPAQAAASAHARGQLNANPLLQAYVGQNGTTPDVQRVYSDLFKLDLDRQKGLAAFDRDKDFQVNGSADIFALQVSQAAVRMWNDSAGPKWLAILAGANKADYEGNPRAIK